MDIKHQIYCIPTRMVSLRTEFNLKEHNIKMYHTENKEKSTIIESFNYTLSQKMKKFEIRKSFSWVDILPRLTCEYNNQQHRTIGMRPVDINEKNRY